MGSNGKDAERKQAAVERKRERERERERERGAPNILKVTKQKIEHQPSASSVVSSDAKQMKELAASLNVGKRCRRQ